MTDPGFAPNARDDLDFLPSDCELPEAARAGSEGTPIGFQPMPSDPHLPRTLYTLHSNRPRWQIIRDYARRHNLTVAEIDALVRALPDYGLRSQLHGTLAVIESGTVVSLADARRKRRG